ncbi:hypothetical protein GCM10020331_083110 [Ectobacillus funiculus]
MDFEEACFQDSEEDMIRQALDNPRNPHLLGITYEGLRQNKWLRAQTNQIAPAYQNPPTPSGKKLNYFSESLEQQGLSPLPAHVPLQDSKYPLRFVPGPNHQFF